MATSFHILLYALLVDMFVRCCIRNAIEKALLNKLRDVVADAAAAVALRLLFPPYFLASCLPLLAGREDVERVDFLPVLP
jgi:hypothetical protein